MTLTLLEKALRVQTQTNELLWKINLQLNLQEVNLKFVQKEKKEIDKLVKELKRRASGK